LYLAALDESRKQAYSRSNYSNDKPSLNFAGRQEVSGDDYDGRYDFAESKAFFTHFSKKAVPADLYISEDFAGE